MKPIYNKLEELIKEYQWAKDHVSDEDVPLPAPDELERIFKRIEEDPEECEEQEE